MVVVAGYRSVLVRATQGRQQRVAGRLWHAIRPSRPIADHAGRSVIVSSRARNWEVERETGLEPATFSLEGRDA
jgi:hypothetical protein